MLIRTLDISVKKLLADCRKHINAELELAFVRKGTATVLYEGESYNLSAGQAMFIYPYYVHGFEYYDDSHCDIFMFDKRIFGNFTEQYRFEPNNCVFNVDDTTVAFIDRVLQSCDNEISPKAIFYAFADCCFPNCKPALNENASYDVMNDVVKYVSIHFNEEIHLDDLGKSVGMSARWLSKSFFVTYGIKLVDFINSVRINYAAYLLETTEQLISEISDVCGFGTLRSFNRIFKNNMGCSPREHRENNRKNTKNIN